MTIKIVIEGYTQQTLKQWSGLTGKPESTIFSRYKRTQKEQAKYTPRQQVGLDEVHRGHNQYSHPTNKVAYVPLSQRKQQAIDEETPVTAFAWRFTAEREKDPETA